MTTDRVILACTVIIALVYMYAITQIPVLAIGDPLGPKAFPRLLGVALLIAAGMLGLEMWRERRKEKSAQETAPFEGGVLLILLVVSIWTGIYYYLFEKLGYILATTAYLLPLTLWFNRGKWVADIASVLLFVGLTYWLFVTLEVRLPQGVLPF